MTASAPVLPGHPRPLDALALGETFGTRYIVTVDTEEEFDWNRPFTRERHGLKHLPYVERFQQFAAKYGIRPIYLIDYPVADNPAAASLLGQLAAAGDASIGIQLHPWVNPPFVEQVNARNSYACNLPADLERAKLTTLVAAIRANLHVEPLIYRAGRYGAGEATVRILCDLGIPFDSSVRALFDYSGGGGPDYASSPLVPYWLQRGRLAELPLTTVLTGAAARVAKGRYPHGAALGPLRAILSRTGLLERIALTPEGIPLAKATAAIDRCLDQGLPLINFSFHSPSLQPGYTPYVRDRADLHHFYDWWRGVIDHCGRRGIRPIAIEDLRDLVFAPPARP